ncbi:M4 family metallopeptidase [Haliea salexigens]|uniref:M4 family metallopeptidase n=1 Tax=Haliea salexigens TaxID=287487 RepID=UPI0004287CCE|nr:M4 family metallopeptidase [Haliea salexigens]
MQKFIFSNLTGSHGWPRNTARLNAVDDSPYGPIIASEVTMPRIKFLLFSALVFFCSAVSGTEFAHQLSVEERESISQRQLLHRQSSIRESYELKSINAAALVDASKKAGQTVSMSTMGSSLTFEFVRLETSAYEGVVHWIGTVAGYPESRVRFTIDGDSIFGGESDEPMASRVAGVIQFNDKSYSLRPMGSASAHVIYASDAASRTGLRLDADSKDEYRARYLEAMGIRKDLLENRDSSTYSIGMGGVTTGITDLASDITRGFTFESEADLPALLKLLGPYIPLIGSESFELREVLGDGEGGHAYDFVEYIDGTLVAGPHLRIFVDGETNEVTQMIGSVEPDRGFSKAPKIDSAAALQLALESAHKMVPRSSFQPAREEPHLVFVRNPRGSKSPVSIAWAIYLHDGEMVELFLVNGETGAVTRNIQIEYGDVQICDAEDSGFSFKCHIRTPVWDENGVCQQAQSKCNLPKFAVPKDVARGNLDMWEDLIGPNCCLSVGLGGLLDVMVNSDLPGDFSVTAPGLYVKGVFDTGLSQIPYETIALQKNSGSDSDPDLIAHEMGHAIHDARSPATRALGAGGTTAENRQTNAVKEGIADINAIIYENYIKSPPFNSPNWESSGRILSEERVFPDDLSSIPGSRHENGRILSYAFHQLVVRSNGVSFDSAARLFLKSLLVLNDADNNDSLSFDEVRQAMIATATTQTQRNAINDAFAAAGISFTPGGGGGGGSTAPPVGGSGTPNAPSFVNGSLQTSCSNGVSIHQNTWGSAGSATQYDVWYSLDSLNYIYSFSRSGTSALTQNTVDVDVKVNACNSSGCSILSLDSYSQGYYCN